MDTMRSSRRSCLMVSGTPQAPFTLASLRFFRDAPPLALQLKWSMGLTFLLPSLLAACCTATQVQPQNACTDDCRTAGLTPCSMPNLGCSLTAVRSHCSTYKHNAYTGAAWYAKGTFYTANATVSHLKPTPSCAASLYHRRLAA